MLAVFSVLSVTLVRFLMGNKTQAKSGGEVGYVIADNLYFLLIL